MADGADNVCYAVNHFLLNAKDGKGGFLKNYDQLYTVNGKEYHVRIGSTIYTLLY